MVKDYITVERHHFFKPGDYISPGFVAIIPDECFPHLIIGDKRYSTWRYSRREIPHNRYVDERFPSVGFLNRDEAHILYNTALRFRGKRALEIGCWLGWSACHLAIAGVNLDVIDPLLDTSDFYESVSSSLKASGVLNSVNLVVGYSPQKVEELAIQLKREWSLIFIDGNHEAPGPLNDAITCEQFAAEDALILFHDLASPEVAEGLDYFKQRGWHTTIYQTAQIMGVAWRGNVEPVRHHPDPNVQWSLPEHLNHYSVSGLSNSYEENETKILLDDYPHIKVRTINLIVFPNWQQQEEDIYVELERVIKGILNQNNLNKISLLIEASAISKDEVTMALSGILIKIFMEENLGSKEEPEISLIGQMNERQWSVLLPHIRYRILLENENKQMASIAENLPTVELNLLENKQFQISSLPSIAKYGERITQLIQDNPGQLTFEEYLYITDVVSTKNPGNFLIFGVGKDSGLWLEINSKGGRTIFIEDDQDWLNHVMTFYPDIEAYLVEYGTRMEEWLNLLVQHNQGAECLSLKLPNTILQTKWDFIFVDAPAGYSNEMPGRMKSIYMAAYLGFKSKNTEVFIHDCDRLVENIYSGYFLHQENFINQIEKLKHYQIKL